MIQYPLNKFLFKKYHDKRCRHQGAYKYLTTTATAMNTSLKNSEFALRQTFSRFIPSPLTRQMLANFSQLKLNSKGLYQSLGIEKESCCLVFPSSTKREFRHFHVVVVQRLPRNVQKGVQTVTTKDCKGPQTNRPKNVGSIKT